MFFKVFIDFQQDIAQIDWSSLDTVQKRDEWFISRYLLQYSEEGQLEG